MGIIELDLSGNHAGKVCTICGKLKQRSEFWNSKSGKLGLHSYCKSCFNEKTRNNNVVRDYRRRLRRTVIERLGSKCERCGFTEYAALQVDHIRGGGVKELRSISYTKYYVRLKNLSMLELKKDYRVLCANCNWIERDRMMGYDFSP